MFRQGQLAVHGLAILLGRNEAGISNRGKLFLHHAVVSVFVRSCSAASIPKLWVRQEYPALTQNLATCEAYIKRSCKNNHQNKLAVKSLTAYLNLS